MEYIPPPLPPEKHVSYQRHRREVRQQILLPILLTTLILGVLGALLIVTIFAWNGDAVRWAAVSTMWLIIPVLVVGVLLLAVLIGIIILLGRVARILPPYSSQAQQVFWMIEGGAKKISDGLAHPVVFLKGIAANLVAALAKKSEPS
jgi:hypothetical protein